MYALRWFSRVRSVLDHHELRADYDPNVVQATVTGPRIGSCCTLVTEAVSSVQFVQSCSVLDGLLAANMWRKWQKTHVMIFLGSRTTKNVGEVCSLVYCTVWEGQDSRGDS